MNQPLLLRIWLGLACTPASNTFARLRKEFSTVEDIYRADEHELRAVLGERKRDIAALADKSLQAAERILNYCEATATEIIAYDDVRYPARLAEIAEPPVLLYSRGTLPSFDEKLFVGVVGTRSMTSYGKKHAFRMATELATAGAVVVSGMARGIDAVAAVGALHAGGKTIAVLGSGIDVIYPSEHHTLFGQIAENGAVVTEYPPGSRPERHHFPQRNRIISALSDGVLLIEGSSSSGALITAEKAEEQGKPIFALPGDADRVTSEAPNLMIRRGAVAVTAADDIVNAFDRPDKTGAFIKMLRRVRFGSVDQVLRSYGVSVRENAPTEVDARADRSRDAVPAYTRATYIGRVASNDDAKEQFLATAPKENETNLPDALSELPKDGAAYRVYAALDTKEYMTADALAEALHDMPFAELSAALTMLELLGAIQNAPGGRYRRADTE